jgi:hypothetical protein
MSIQDVPLSKRKSLGSEETMGDIYYHYQKWENVFLFFRKESKKVSLVETSLCVPSIRNHWMGSFLTVTLTKRDLDDSELSFFNAKPQNPSITVRSFINAIKRCRKRFIIVAVNIVWEGLSGAHANIILIDNSKKSIELFEPHGKQTEETTFSGITGGYHIVSTKLKQFFSQYMKGYVFLSPDYFLPTFNYQKNDPNSYGGLCITWGIMYVYYRLLNPKKTQKQIAMHMKHKIKQTKILQFVKYVEETIKS